MLVRLAGLGLGEIAAKSYGYGLRGEGITRAAGIARALLAKDSSSVERTGDGCDRRRPSDGRRLNSGTGVVGFTRNYKRTPSPSRASVHIQREDEISPTALLRPAQSWCFGSGAKVPVAARKRVSSV